MLKKIFAIALGLSASVLAADAAHLTAEQAMGRLMADGPMKAKAYAASQLKLVASPTTASGDVSAYIFAPANGRGFVILSADDMAMPVIGYSDSSSIDSDNLPPALVWWLGEQARHIEFLRENGYEAKYGAPVHNPEYGVIEPLLSTKWNQDAPYNLECPTVSGTQAPTGCVATSFAQVMNYFKYPAAGQGSIRYIDGYGITRTMNFKKEFDWDNMLNEYPANKYTEEQASAVALLMKSCGYSIEMNYGKYASGAQSFKLRNAAVEYFKYDVGTYYTEREYYSLDTWTKLVYENLKNVGPVIYDGQALEGGHSFVCDGYDGNGYFHFNWGWGGISDGYYALDVLNPETQGIGGADGGFNYHQGALLGMQPAKEGVESSAPLANIVIYGNATAELDGSKVVFSATDSKNPGWGNASFRPINVEVGGILTKVGSDAAPVDIQGALRFGSGSEVSSMSMNSGQYYTASASKISVPLPTLEDGDYILTIACKDTEVEDAVWQPIVTTYGCVNYCYVNVVAGVATVKTADPAVLTFEDVEIVSPLYRGRKSRLVATVKNDSKLQLTKSLSPVLVRDNQIQYQSDYLMITVNPGEEIEQTSTLVFKEVENATNAGLGEYQLMLLDVPSNKIIAEFGNYEMKYAATSVTLALDEFAIVDAPVESVTSGTRTFEETYKVADDAKFDLHLKFLIEKGYLDTQVRIVGAQYNPETNKFIAFDSDLYNTIPYLGEEQDFDLTLPLDFSGRPGGYVYRINSAYLMGSTNKTIGSIYLTYKPGVGVEVIEMDDNTAIEYYDMFGKKVVNPSKGQILIRKIGTKADKVIY